MPERWWDIVFPGAALPLTSLIAAWVVQRRAGVKQKRKPIRPDEEV